MLTANDKVACIHDTLALHAQVSGGRSFFAAVLVWIVIKTEACEDVLLLLLVGRVGTSIITVDDNLVAVHEDAALGLSVLL